MQSTQWIAACAALVLLEQRPDLTLVYLPHLDYDPQRFEILVAHWDLPIVRVDLTRP